MQELDSHRYFRSEAQHATLYCGWGYQPTSSWFRTIFHSASTVESDGTEKCNPPPLPNDKTLQPWQKLFEFSSRRADELAQKKASFEKARDEQGVTTDRYSGSEWESILQSAQGRVEEARKYLKSSQYDPNETPTAPSSQLALSGAASILYMDSGSSTDPASLPSPSVHQSTNSGSHHGEANAKVLKGKGGRRRGRGRGANLKGG